MLGISPVKCHLWNPAVLQPFAWQNVTGGSVLECAVQCECNMCWTLCGLPCRACSSCYMTSDFRGKLKTYLLHPSIFNHPVSPIFHHLGLIMRWSYERLTLLLTKLKMLQNHMSFGNLCPNLFNLLKYTRSLVTHLGLGFRLRDCPAGFRRVSIEPSGDVSMHRDKPDLPGLRLSLIMWFIWIITIFDFVCVW